jgi:hypothetical protein
VSGVLVSKEKHLLFSHYWGYFWHFSLCFWMLSWAIGGLLLETLSLGCYLLLLTMLGTVFRVYSMLLYMEINTK